ncbi:MULTISPECIES: GAF domain-containing protein [Rhodococcus]|uniref:GAF domain-containing protein n=1 Tax=Rhodococcus TaxID=1827 RepID=UPI0006BB4FEA|nr:GAF domain-containing protein [Rhodococcus opacus]
MRVWTPLAPGKRSGPSSGTTPRSGRSSPAAAAGAGIGACLSVPLVVDSTVPGELVGSFNVYSDRGEAFDPFDEKLMRLPTTAAAAAISNARRWQAAGETIAQLEVVLGSRAEIDQAKVC